MTDPEHQTSLIDHLSKLVEFKTQNGNAEGYEACFNHLNSVLTSTGMHVKKYRSNGLPSLMATSRDTSNPKVILQAHIDVVPALDKSYKLIEKSGKLYGRGVYDMKFAAACYLSLVEELKDNLAEYNFGIMFSFDEEIGGKDGVKYLLAQGYSSDICILPDGGNDWKIETTCNAVWIAHISANGQSAHGSRPWEGKNAINALIEGLDAIHKVFGELKPHKNSITVSKISGGQAMNQVPDAAKATLDMRFINDREYERISQEIKTITSKLGLTLETEAYVKSRYVDLDQNDVKSFLDVASKHIGEPIEKTHSFGASDACYFADYGIPTIVIRPHGGGAHSEHEWIDKASLNDFYEVIKKYIETTK